MHEIILVVPSTMWLITKSTLLHFFFPFWMSKLKHTCLVMSQEYEKSLLVAFEALRILTTGFCVSPAATDLWDTKRWLALHDNEQGKWRQHWESEEERMEGGTLISRCIWGTFRCCWFYRSFPLCVLLDPYSLSQHEAAERLLRATFCQDCSNISLYLR